MSNLPIEKFESLMNNYSKMLLKIAYSYTKNVQTSEDVVQDAFVKLYKVHKTFVSDEQIKYWLIRVTINRSLDILKHNKKEIIIDPEYINNLSLDSFSLDKDEEMRLCVLALKDIYKTVIILFYYDNYSINEIAKILNIKEVNVKVRLHRARQELKKLIDERLGNNGKR